MWEYSRSSRPEVFLGKGVLKICSKFSGEYQCQSSISIKLQKLVLFIHLLLSVLCYFTYICCHLLIWTKSIYLLGLYTHIHIYLLRSRYCTNVQLFSEIIKNTFCFLFILQIFRSHFGSFFCARYIWSFITLNHLSIKKFDYLSFTQLQFF